MRKLDNTLVLPCLRGAIGSWIYYSVIIPFTELKRIDTHHKIKEDVALDKWLQRELSERVDIIKKYLLNEDERFFNTIIVGVYGDVPDWYSLDLSVLSEHYQVNISDRVKDSLGVMTLSGKEILFTVDGQHRVEAIKKGLEENPERFQKDELSVVFVAHQNDEKGFVKTRKLFATINREAKQPNENDLAIIDETYAYNIVARMVYAQYDKFKGLIKLTKDASMDRDDHKYFTNLLNLVKISKILYKISKYKDDKFTSPSYEKRQELYLVSKGFYDFVINNVDEYVSFFSKKKKLEDFRNATKNKPLNLLFMPIGINMIAHTYLHFIRNKKIDKLKEKINKVDYDLYNGHFKEIYFSPAKNKIITSNDVVGRRLMLFLLGEDTGINNELFKVQLAKAYNINELSEQFKNFKLPTPV